MPRHKKDKPFGGGRYTKSQFFSFIRSGLRSKSRRWAPIFDALEAAKRKSRSKTNARLKWEFKCNSCKKWFPRSSVSVDHIQPVGSLNEFEDLPDFVRNLFCEIDNLQVLCSTCHSIKTGKERNKIEEQDTNG